MLFLSDIDGTIANIEHRRKFVRSKPKNWPAFNAAMVYDTPVVQTVAIIKAMVDIGHTVILASGRNEASRYVTEKWLDENVGKTSVDGHAWSRYNPFWDKLYMRADGDYRSDDIVKEEILHQIINDYGKKPDMVIDDRKQVVDMWIRNDVFVLDVAQGKGDF